MNGTLTADERKHLSEWQAAMRERDRSSEPQRDAIGVLTELRTALRFAGNQRAAGYEARQRALQGLKHTPKSSVERRFSLRSELAQAIGQVRDAESRTRQLRADVARWEAIARDQEQQRREASEARRRADRDDRRRSGLEA